MRFIIQLATSKQYVLLNDVLKKYQSKFKPSIYNINSMKQFCQQIFPIFSSLAFKQIWSKKWTVTIEAYQKIERKIQVKVNFFFEIFADTTIVTILQATYNWS